jgi:ubiquinone/menaquinone biosynthesis C-methylase UbiE
MSELKLNIGSGDDYRDGYVNIDYSPITNNKNKIRCDLFHNIKSGLPFEDSSVDEVVFRETLEHFNRNDGLFVLKEIFRVMRPGSKLDVTVPNAKRQMITFIQVMDKVKTIEDFLYAHEKFTPIKFHDDVAGGTVRTWHEGEDIGDFMSHKTFYSQQMLRVVLESVGFSIEKIDDAISAIATK